MATQKKIGRPKTKNVEKQVPFTLRMDKPFHKRLKHASIELEKNMTDIILEVVGRYLDKKKL